MATITIACPKCGAKSQIDARFRDRRMRCAQGTCRTVFKIGSDGTAVLEAVPPTPPPGGTRSLVRDPLMLRLNSATILNWRTNPPGLRGADANAETEEQGGGPPIPEYYFEDSDQGFDVDIEMYRPRPKRIWFRLLIFVILAATISGFFAARRIMHFWKMSEDALVKRAHAEYEAGRYTNAQDAYKELTDRYPYSSGYDRYVYLVEFCNLQWSVQEAGNAVRRNDAVHRLRDAYGTLSEFVASQRGQSDFFKEYQEELGEVYYKLIHTSCDTAEHTGDGSMLEPARRFLDQSRTGSLGRGDRAERQEELRKRIAKAERTVTKIAAHRRLLAEFKRLAESTDIRSVEQGQALSEQTLSEFPELINDQQIKDHLAAGRVREPSLVRFEPHANNVVLSVASSLNEGSLFQFASVFLELSRNVTPPMDDGPGFVVTPLIQHANLQPTPIESTVFSLSRGILYAFEERNGKVRWSMRLGVDSNILPLTLSRPYPDLTLVLSQAHQALFAVETPTGKIRWTYRHNSTATANPALVDRKLYLPTREGRLFEIDLDTGRPLGSYDLGFPIPFTPTVFTLPPTVPRLPSSLSQDPTVPTPAPPTTLANRKLLVPSEHKRVFILNLDSRRADAAKPGENQLRIPDCDVVLYTMHPAGSLRSAALVFDATMILLESQKLSETKLRHFTLTQPFDTVVCDPAKNFLTVPGWIFYPPHLDGDTFGLVTDRSQLALFGINRDTQDQPVFSLAPPHSIGPARDVVGYDIANSARPLIVRSTLNQWWVLVGSNLYRERFDLYRQRSTASKDVSNVGSSLHVAQYTPLGATVATLSTSPGRYQATMFDGATNQVGWQRQLGLQPVAPPVALSKEVFLVLDRSSSIWYTTRSQILGDGKPERGWREVGEWVEGSNDETYSRLMPLPGGKEVVVLTHAVSKGGLRIRGYEVDRLLGAAKEHRVAFERNFPHLPVLAGVPLVTANSVLMPCDDGNVHEFPIKDTGPQGVSKVYSFAWRDAFADHQSQCHPLLVTPDLLLLNDGGFNLTSWTRAADAERSKGLQWISKLRVRFEAPLTTPLVPVTAAGRTGVLVGDSQGNLLLLDPNELRIDQRWNLNGSITLGPFVVGDRIGCVIDHKRLVWQTLQGGNASPAWEYESDSLLRHEPVLLGGRLLLAESSGRFTWLDANTGQIVGRHELRTRSTPATTPVPLDKQHALAPLSDGVLLLLRSPD